MTLYWITDETCPLCPLVEPEVRAFAAQHGATVVTMPLTDELLQQDFGVPSLYYPERGLLTQGRFCVQAMAHLMEIAA